MNEPKYFTLEEARSTLPLVTRIAEDINRIVAQLRGVPGGVAFLHGALPEERLPLETRDDALQLREELEALAEELMEIGAELKGLQPVLVDFRSRRDDQDIYLCWELGEPDILFWHTLADGYQGRQPL
ncbi:MAG: DUF2203 domain-containing protein [Calditrichota bacterium]